jgi:pSer/pThr/pTyr-binding forkhead associated (FHA) protein
MPDSSLCESTDRVCLRLLDSSNGAVVQTWQFQGQSEITIGRSADRDVRVGDQHVSRLHAVLRYASGTWTIFSQGRNGLLIGDEPIEQAELADDTTFRLGAAGPVLSFQFDRESGDSVATIDMDSVPILLLRIDEERKAREVAEIVEADYFQHLRAKARQIREGKQ